MLNRTILVGRLTKDPELRETPNGVKVCTFTLAVNRTFKNKNGETDADFLNIVAFKKTAELVAAYLSKGSLTGVDGRLQSRSYENKEGKRVFVTEVVADSVQFLEPKSSNQQNNRKQTQQEQNQFANPNGPIDIQDDDLPF